MIPPPLLRRLRLSAVALLGVAGAALWLALRPPSGAGLAGAAAHRLATIPFTDVHPWGANVFLEREVEAWKAEQTVVLAADAGIRWAKQHLPWADVERERGRLDWAKYDRIVDVCDANGIEVIWRIDWTPAWAARDDHGPGANNVPADPADLARFVGEAAAHFKGRVRFYQIWNEPNLASEWGYRPVDPASYVALLAAAAAAARAADPAAVIIAAPLAINTETLAEGDNLNDLDYLRGMYAAGAAEHFDILAANAFGMDRPPNDPPAPDRLNFRRIELQRAIMREAGDDETPIWLSEYGWNAAPVGLADNIWGHVPAASQAEWTVEGVRLAQAEWPWAGVFGLWYFRQWGGIAPDRADYWFAAVMPDFTPTRLFDAVRDAASGTIVAGPGFWQERSAPVRVTPGGRWRWLPREGASDGQALVAQGASADGDDGAARPAESTAAPGAADRDGLVFTFRGRQVVARLATGRQAGTLAVELDGQAQSPRALGGAEAAWADVTLVEGLDGGAHTLRLTAGAAGGEIALDHFRVDSGPPADPRTLWWALLALAAAALLASILRDARQVAVRLNA
ncbi:MAG: endo-1,4-beta-xylanase [Ardenticatenales bacterium]|nr:endo-1,4-beta-xylanase [Ardenticatenales bacterium]